MSVPALPKYCEQCGAQLNILGNCSAMIHLQELDKERQFQDWLAPHVEAARFDPFKALHHQSVVVLERLYKSIWAAPANPHRTEALRRYRDVMDECR